MSRIALLSNFVLMRSIAILEKLVNQIGIIFTTYNCYWIKLSSSLADTVHEVFICAHQLYQDLLYFKIVVYI